MAPDTMFTLHREVAEAHLALLGWYAMKADPATTNTVAIGRRDTGKCVMFYRVNGRPSEGLMVFSQDTWTDVFWSEITDQEFAAMYAKLREDVEGL